MADEHLYIEVSDEELDEAIAKADRALHETETVEDTVNAVLEHATQLPDAAELKGLEYTQRRILTMIPGLREAYFLVRQVQTLLGIAPELALLIGVALLIRDLVAMQQRQDERMRELEIEVRRAGGFASLKEARAWMDEQTRLARQAYQGSAP